MQSFKSMSILVWKLVTIQITQLTSKLCIYADFEAYKIEEFIEWRLFVCSMYSLFQLFLTWRPYNLKAVRQVPCYLLCSRCKRPYNVILNKYKY